MPPDAIRIDTRTVNRTMTNRETSRQPSAPRPSHAPTAHSPHPQPALSADEGSLAPCSQYLNAFATRYDAALTLAASAHRTQTRKGSDTPYIVHPVHVSILLIRHGFGEDVAIAGLLHDVVEDQDVTLAEIEEVFGPEVAEMVDALTERKRVAGMPQSWETRKQEALERLARSSASAAAVKAADVLHNAMTLAEQLRRQRNIWRYYSRGPEQTLWYYRGVAAIVGQKLGQISLVQELETTIANLEQAISDAGEASGA